MEYNRFDSRQLQIDQKEPHECNKVCRWWWLVGPIVVEKTFDLCQKENTPLIVAKMISFTCDKKTFSSVLLMPSLWK